MKFVSILHCFQVLHGLSYKIQDKFGYQPKSTWDTEQADWYEYEMNKPNTHTHTTPAVHQ